MSELIDTIARVGVFYLINGIWVGLLVVAVAAGLLCLFKKAPAASLHRLLWVAVIVIVVTPILFSSSGLQTSPFYANVPGNEQIFEGVKAEVVSEKLPRSNAGNFSSLKYQDTWSIFWPAAVWGVWMIMSVMMVVRLVVGYRQAESLIRSARPGGTHLQVLFDRYKRRWVNRHGVGLYASDEVASPAVLGVFQSVILMPAPLVEHFSDGELEQILKHEIGHIHRWDAWGNLLQRLLEAFLWCNPAIWWLSRQLSLTREMACDDYAIRYGHSSRDYAICLTRLTQMMRDGRRQSVGLGAMKRRPDLIRRVEYLLGDRGISAWLSQSSVWIAAGVFMLVAVVVVQIGPLWDVPGRAEAYMRIAKWSKPSGTGAHW